MNKHEFELYLELYKRKKYNKIPIGKYSDGSYFYMTSKQIRALELLNDDITTFIGYGGSARSGKSIIECTAIIFDCLAYPGVGLGLGRKELTTLKRTVLITLFKQIIFFGLNENDYNFNQQSNKISFKNGSDIFLIDLAYKPSDPLNTRFGGFELTKAFIDESNESNISVIHKIYERTGWRLNDFYKIKRKVFECFNPDKNHVYSRYYIPFRDKKEDDYKKFIPALPSDNPHPSVKEWIEDVIKTGDKTTIERQIHGNFEYDDDPNWLIHSFDAVIDLFNNSHVKGGDKYIICDAARFGADKAIIMVFDGLIAVERFTFEISKTIHISKKIKELQRKYGIPNRQTLVDADGVGGGVADEVGCISFNNNKSALNIRVANKKQIGNIQFDNIKSQCGFKLSDIINSSEMWINFECTDKEKEEIKQDFSVLKQQSEINKRALIPKKKMKEYIGRSPDWLDTFIMRMYFEIKKRNNVLTN